MGKGFFLFIFFFKEGGKGRRRERGKIIVWMIKNKPAYTQYFLSNSLVCFLALMKFYRWIQKQNFFFMSCRGKIIILTLPEYWLTLFLLILCIQENILNQHEETNTNTKSGKKTKTKTPSNQKTNKSTNQPTKKPHNKPTLKYAKVCSHMMTTIILSLMLR